METPWEEFVGKVHREAWSTTHDSMIMAQQVNHSEEHGLEGVRTGRLKELAAGHFPLGVVKAIRTVDPSLDSREGLSLATGTDYEVHEDIMAGSGRALPIQTAPCDRCRKSIADAHETAYGSLCTGCFIETVESVVGPFALTPVHVEPPVAPSNIADGVKPPHHMDDL